MCIRQRFVEFQRGKAKARSTTIILLRKRKIMKGIASALVLIPPISNVLVEAQGRDATSRTWRPIYVHR